LNAPDNPERSNVEKLIKAFEKSWYLTEVIVPFFSDEDKTRVQKVIEKKRTLLLEPIEKRMRFGWT